MAENNKKKSIHGEFIGRVHPKRENEYFYVNNPAHDTAPVVLSDVHLNQ